MTNYITRFLKLRLTVLYGESVTFSDLNYNLKFFSVHSELKHYCDITYVFSIIFYDFHYKLLHIQKFFELLHKYYNLIFP